MFWIWLKANSTGCLATEDLDEAGDLLSFDIDLGDCGVQGREWAVDHRDRIADGEVDLIGAAAAAARSPCSPAAGATGLLLRGRGQDRDDFFEAKRCRGVPVTDEPGDARGVAHRTPGLIGQVHSHQDVSGELVAADVLALAGFDLRDLLHRDLDLEDVVLHVQGLTAGFEVGLDPVLVAGVGVHDVPVARRHAHLLAERLDRIDVLAQLQPRAPRPRQPTSASAVLFGVNVGIDDRCLGDHLGLGWRLGFVDQDFVDRRLGSVTSAGLASADRHRNSLRPIGSGCAAGRRPRTDR